MHRKKRMAWKNLYAYAYNSADSSSPYPSSDSVNFAKIAGGEWPARRRCLPPIHWVLLNHSQPRKERGTNKGLLYLHRDFEQRFRRVCAVAASSLREISRRVSNRDIYLPTIAKDLEVQDCKHIKTSNDLLSFLLRAIILLIKLFNARFCQTFLYTNSYTITS